MKWKALIISALIWPVIIYASATVVRPTQRITEPDKVDQHIRVQDEIYKNMTRIIPNSGFDSCASGTKIVYFTPKYNAATDFVPIVCTRGYSVADTGKVCVAATSDSSFTVFGTPATVKFYWMTIGVKK